MARPRTWRSLIIGIVVFGAIVAIAVAVLSFARIGALRGDTERIYMVTNAALRVIEGTEVWLGGQKVGVVKAIHFRHPNADTTERLALELEILSQHLEHIRRDSDVQLRPGGSLIGAPVVYITMGSASAAALRPGDTLRALGEVATRRTRAAVIAELGDSILAVAAGARAITMRAQETGDEIVRIRKQTEQQARKMTEATSAFKQRALHSGGSMARFHHDSTLRAAVNRVTAQADSIQQLLHSSQTSLGRFRRDTSITTAAQHILRSADTLRRRLASPMSALPNDSLLIRSLERTQLQLDSLVQDVKRRPLKYLSL